MRLARIGQQASALILAVTLYLITRDEGPVLATVAWLGFLASIALVVILPLQLAGLLGGRANWFGAVTWLVWFPMLVFEVTLALWLILKGVAMPGQTTRAVNRRS